MRLRNKKTGEILETGGHVATVWKKNGYGDNYSYNSLEELNENWEDYKPTEPLSKDEEIISFISLLERFDRKLSKLCGEEEE